MRSAEAISKDEDTNYYATSTLGDHLERRRNAASVHPKVRVTIRSFNACRRTPHERMFWTGCSGKAGVGADQPFGDGVLSQRERGMQIELLHQPCFVELNRLERHI